MVILENVKSVHTCVSNALLSISKYANNSFKENSRMECEAFVEMLVAVLHVARVGKPWTYEGGDGKNHETFPHIPDEPNKLQNFSPSKLLSVVYGMQPAACYNF